MVFYMDFEPLPFDLEELSRLEVFGDVVEEVRTGPLFESDFGVLSLSPSCACRQVEVRNLSESISLENGTIGKITQVAHILF